MIHRFSEKSPNRNSRKIPATVVAISLVSFLSLAASNWSTPSLAQTELPDPGGLPARREGGGTRGCNTWGLTALVPSSNLGKTLAEYPTFFVYIPANTAQAAEIGLEDENGRRLYSTTLEQKLQPGVFSFTIPTGSDNLPLKLGKNYKWYIELFCDESPGGFVEGWVRRVEPNDSLESELKQASKRDRIRIYTREGMWYDALKILVELRQATPDDITVIGDWETLLKELELEHLAQEIFSSPSGS